MKKVIVVSVAVLFLGVLMSYQTARGAKCGPDHVWVPGHRTASGYWVDGWCRPAAKTGYVWVAGYRDPNGVWVPGYWKPVDPAPSGQVWVPGYRAANGRWVPGHCR